MYCTDLSRHIAGLLLQLFVDSSSSGHLSLLHFLISSQSIIHPNDGKTPSKMGCLVHPSLIHHIQSPWNHQKIMKKSPWNHPMKPAWNHPIRPPYETSIFSQPNDPMIPVPVIPGYVASLTWVSPHSPLHPWPVVPCCRWLRRRSSASSRWSVSWQIIIDEWHQIFMVSIYDIFIYNIYI